MRRDLILDAAGKLFQEKGYETTTIDEIAALAELGKGTIYSYFKSKEEVYIASFENSLDDFENKIRSVDMASDSAVERLRKLLEVFIAYYNKNKGFMDTLLGQTDEQLFIRLGYLGERLRDRFTKWLEFMGGSCRNKIAIIWFLAKRSLLFKRKRPQNEAAEKVLLKVLIKALKYCASAVISRLF